MNVFEMEGFLRGKCLPGDMKVNETTAEYLVRKLGQAGELTAAHSTIEKAREVTNCPEGVDLQDHLKQLVDENAALKKFCKNAAFDADYESELGMERGGFTDAFSDVKTPATDSILRAAEARGVDMFAAKLRIPGDDPFFDAVAEGVAGAAAAFANQLREGKV